MHEIRLTVEPECLGTILRLAEKNGIGNLSVSETELYLPRRKMLTIGVELSTPDASRFLCALQESTVVEHNDFTITSRELRAIINRQDIARLTRPISEPIEDVRQDLWQQSHFTASYIARAVAGGLLLAMGLIDNNPIQIVVAALFIPFLSPVLAAGFGLYSKDRKLLFHGLRAVAGSIALAFLCGLVGAFLAGKGPGFDDFKSPLLSFGLSAIIGVTAGLNSADDAGRRYLVSVAAAVQLAIFPVWFGLAALHGGSAASMWESRLGDFAVNLVTIPVTAIAAYGVLNWFVHRQRI